MNPQTLRAASGSSRARTGRPRATPPSGRRQMWLLVALALVLMVLVRGFLVQSFYVPSASMEPTLQPGDRMLVAKLAPEHWVHRGDVVVFDGTTVFAGQQDDPTTSSGVIGRALGSLASALSLPTNETDYVKRVIGMPGDTVVCCDIAGRIEVNGSPVQERYLMRGDKPSTTRFSAVVPSGHIWVMGDHRSDSADSRSHLGDPGGGMVPMSDVIGRPILVYWPLNHAGTLASGSTLADLPRARN